MTSIPNTTKALKEEIVQYKKAVKTFFCCAPYYKGMGYAEHPAEEIPVARAYAFQKMLASEKKHIYTNDLIVGSITGHFSEGTPDDEVRYYEQYTSLTGERGWFQGCDHYASAYDRLLKLGVGGILKEIEDSMQKYRGDREKEIFLTACRIEMEAFRDWIAAHAAETNDPEIIRICQKIAVEAPSSFREALQLVWFAHTVYQLQGLYAMALGRMDQYLYPYYRHDIDAGVMTDEEAQNLLENTFIKMYEQRLWFGRDDVCNICIAGVTPDGENCWSAGQDASHFVNCRGKVTIEDNLFENQLDDAVNFHGIYTQIDKIADNKILVEYKHWQTVGIDIYSVGDRIQMLEQDSQMPVAEATITDVEVLNNYKTALTLDNLSEKVTEGMIVESLDDNAEALIQNNIIRNNRARGMLLASRGRTVVRNNHFNSGGAAIQFESDPFKWYECGGTRDVLIEGNLFDDCKYGKWGRAVIDIGKRRRNVEGFYYHGKIEIRNNRFTQTDYPCVAADNVGELILDDSNTYVSEVSVVPAHCIWNGVKYE